MTFPHRHDIFVVNLDPTVGSEIQKTRPCVVISPDEANRYLRTVIVAPMTTTTRGYATRVAVTFQRKRGEVALDQMRAVDKARLVKRLGTAPRATSRLVAQTLVEMFADGRA